MPDADARRAAPRPRLERLPLLALGGVALLTALWGGLARLGWQWPAAHPGPAALHGPLMVSGFLGTLITLERAAALGLAWAYAAPVLTGVGALLLVTGLAAEAAPWLMLAGSLVGLALFARLLWRAPALYVATMALGLVAWSGGNALWLAGWPFHRVVPWWGAFLVFVIAGERLELTRLFAPPAAVQALFVGALAVLAAGVAGGAVWPDAGVRLAGAGMVALAAWLARWDIARRTIRETGLPRYMAACLLSGYFWLAIGGALAVHEGLVVAGPRYDAVLHALFLGFVMAMIFGHAPAILPGVLGLPIAWRPWFYVPLVALHLTLAARVAGDLAPLPALRQWAGLLNAAVVLVFLAGTGLTAARQQAARSPRAASRR